MAQIADILRNSAHRLDAAAVLDILIITAIVYALLMALRGTTAMTLLRGGLVTLGALFLLSYVLQLSVVNFLLRNSLPGLVLGVIVIFQPEIRRALERAGRTSVRSLLTNAERDEAIDEIATAVTELAHLRHGALLVMERSTGLEDYIQSGVRVDAGLNAKLIEGIFYPNSPLHDKAMIIRDQRIVAASCTLPVADGAAASHLGMRHRAALGVSEQTDAIAIVVSEQSGAISVASEGRLIPLRDESRVRSTLEALVARRNGIQAAPLPPVGERLMFQPPQGRSWRVVVTPIALAVVSLLVAVVLWVAVTDAQNPNKVATFTGAIEVSAVNVPEGLAVASIRQPNVSLRISAAADTFGKLTTADFHAQVDLSGVRDPSSDQLVVAHVVGKKDVQIVDVSPQFVTVALEPVTSKLVPVAANRLGSAPQGFAVPTVDISPPTVRVTGATSLVQLVANAGADVNLTGLRVSLQQQFPLIPRDARGAEIRGVSVDPGLADIKVNVAQQEVTLALTVVAQVQGTVAEGYNLVSIVSDPPALSVSGPLEQLQAISFVTTDPIDVSGQRSDITRTVHLRLPAGLQASRDSVTVRLKVAPALGELSFTLIPQVTSLDEGLKATLQTASITVKLRGEMPTLRTLVPGALKATVNASGLGEGVFALTPTVNPPEGVQVETTDPSQVVVVLKR